MVRSFRLTSTQPIAVRLVADFGRAAGVPLCGITNTAKAIGRLTFEVASTPQLATASLVEAGNP